MKLRYGLVLGLVLHCAAHAEEAAWKQNIELGFVQTGGNTQTQTLNTKAKIMYEDQLWRTQVEGSALKSSNQKQNTGEQYTLSLQQDWKFSKQSYVFGRLAYVADRFANIRSQYSENIGYGRILMDNARVKWTADISAGLRQTQWVSLPFNQDTTLRVSTDVHGAVNPQLHWSQILVTEGGQSGFVSRLETSLQQQISASLSSKMTYSVDHTSKVAKGIQKLNTAFLVTLVWSH